MSKRRTNQMDEKVERQSIVKQKERQTKWEEREVIQTDQQ